jgi:glycosyltransferase involved in cell wall biosynthesis
MSTVRVDYTSVGRRASGVERMAIEQFNSAALSPLTVEPFTVGGGGRLNIMAAQLAGLPLCAVRNPSDVFVFPCFPPSPYFALAPDRSVLYVHDLFLLTRSDLNRAAKYYMAPMFRIALKKLRYFFTNSLETMRQLKSCCNPAAEVVPYRPWIRNVFGLAVGNRSERTARPDRLNVLSLGTIEPRKNLIAAADICEALSARLQCAVDYHIVGRLGWGEDANLLSKRPNVVLHGALSDEEIRSIVEAADIFLSTSHDEGLGRPLLEAQFAGLPIVTPEAVVFREVLEESGIYIDTKSSAHAADRIAQSLSDECWRARYVRASTANVARWNAIADRDRSEVISFLSRLCDSASRVHQ